MGKSGWVLYGSELSPFTLKVAALCRHKGLGFRFLPEEGGTLENLRVQIRRALLVRRRLPLTWPRMTELDEFPLVPFLFGPAGENLYDSSSIAGWLDQYEPLRGRSVPVVPTGDPATRFAAWLIDEYADEYGLYMVHHNRWKVSATDNDAGRRLAREMRSLVGAAQPLVAGAFRARQVRRMPYLFSTAPEGFRIPDMPKRLQPPSRSGFPATHELLEDSFARLLNALEAILQHRPCLLGHRFTVADASIYGQLGMNLTDPSAAALIKARAPTLYGWLKQIHRGNFPGSRADGDIGIDRVLTPLLAEICRTYVPLMKQNLAAYRRWRGQGETLFNEAAFNRGKSLYDGLLDGRPFRSVAKTFQVKTWLDMRRRWAGLDAGARRALADVLPAGHGLDRDD